MQGVTCDCSWLPVTQDTAIRALEGKELLLQRYFWKRCPRDTPAYVHHEACLRTLPEHVCKEGNNPMSLREEHTATHSHNRTLRSSKNTDALITHINMDGSISVTLNFFKVQKASTSHKFKNKPSQTTRCLGMPTRAEKL